MATGKKPAAASISEPPNALAIRAGIRRRCAEGTDRMNTRERPLSPHLQVYKLEYTMVLSGGHRIAGLALSAAFIALVAVLGALAASPDCYAWAAGLLGSFAGKCVFALAVTGFWYHFTTGLRHLRWDAGVGLERAEARRSGRVAVLVIAVLSVLSTWAIFR
jgi:succinate dehydrogenase / fumarate reductase, cytochrome b subunit